MVISYQDTLIYTDLCLSLLRVSLMDLYYLPLLMFWGFGSSSIGYIEKKYQFIYEKFVDCFCTCANNYLFGPNAKPTSVFN